MKRYLMYLPVLLSVTGCIGTDILDDEAVQEVILVEPKDGAIMVGGKLQLKGTYHNMFGMKTEVNLEWKAKDNAILSIDNTGLVTGRSAGQTTVNAIYKNVKSEDVLITVITNINDIAKVVIAPPSKSRLVVGETLQLTANALNIRGSQIEGKTFSWSTSDATVATVSSTGLVTALKNGSVQITAKSESISSTAVSLEVGNEKTATLKGTRGYTAKGTATLKKDGSGNLLLELSADFEASIALGTFIYLSNSTSGAATASSGVELGGVTTNGAKSFNITAINPDIKINSYRYVIVLCKPASITFGYGDFNK